MRTITLRNTFIGIFGLTTLVTSSQNVAINTSGNTAVTGAILDLSNSLTNGSAAFLAPYVSLTNLHVLAPVTGTGPAGLLVYNTNAGLAPNGAGYYYWDGSQWNYFYNSASGSGVTSVTGTAPIVITGTASNPNVTLQGQAGTVCYGTGGGSAFTTVGTTGQFLESQGAGTPIWAPASALGTRDVQPNSGSAVVIANGVNQVVNSALGNVQIDVQGTSGGVFYGTGLGTPAVFSVAGTSGQVLTSTGAGAPIWGTPNVAGANSGTSLNGTNVILGNAYSATAGKLLANTEIPFNGFNIDYSTVGGSGTIGIDLAAGTSAARALEIGGSNNTERNNGLKSGSTFNAAPSAASTYMMYANANGDVYSMTAGATNNVLTWTATGPSWIAPAGAAVAGANSGTSLNGTNVILGNAYSATTGKLLANTEIPFNGFNIDYSTAGGAGTIGIDLAAGTTAAQALEVGATTNTIRVNGLKNGSTYNATPSAATSYMMYVNTNGDMMAMPAGAANNVLTWTGTGPSWVTPAGAAVAGANSGTSLNGTNVILGNAYSGTAGKLLANTEIPFNGFNIDFSTVGGSGTIGIDLAAGTSAARALEIGGSNNTERNNGLKLGSTFNAAPAAASTYMMYANSNGDEYSMPAGATNNVLTWTATGPSWVTPAGAAVTGADDGTSINGTDVILGNAFGGTAAQLTQNTEIPLNGKNLTFSLVGGTANIGIDLAANTSAAQALEIGETNNTIRVIGLKNGSTFNATPAAATSYMMYANTNGDMYAMPAGATNQVLTVTASGPAWVTPAAIAVAGANSGTSLNGTNVILGNAYGGTLGKLLANTEIPFNGFNIDFSGAGTIGIDLAVNTSAAQALEIGATTNTIRVNGLKNGSTFNVAPAAATTYMMYANTNGDLLAMPAGATNQVLTVTASGPAWVTPAAIAVAGANSGTSLNGTNVILGNAYGGTLGKLLANTEIPFNGFNIDFSGAGTIGIDLAVNTSAARALEIGGITNTIRNNGLKAGSTYNVTPAAATTYMMYANTNGDEYSMPAGAANNVLTWTATGPSWVTPAGAAVTGANSGTSMNGTNVILGNAYSGTLGKLLANTEIPFNGFNIDFSTAGGAGTIGIDLAAGTSAARALEIGATTNTIRINGLKAGSTFNAASAATTNYMMYANTNGDVMAMPAGAVNNILTWTATGPTWSAGGTVTGANSGTSMNGTNVILGNAYGGTLGQLLANTEIPFNGFNIDFSGTTGKIGIDLAASTTAAQALEIGQTNNTIRVNGLKNGSTYNVTPAAATTYMVYANTNGDLLAMPAGAANNVLTWTGTGPSWVTPAGAAVTGANSGASMNGTNVILGNAYSGTLGKLLANTEIPFNGFNIDFSTAGGAGTIGIDLPAATSAARALEIGANTNTIRINGLKAGSTFNAASAATTNYMMYANTNGDVYSMPAGAANDVLTFTATGPAWQAPAGSVTGANSGTSMNGTNVILGNAYSGTLGKLLANTEIPFNGFNIDFSTVGGAGTIGIDLGAGTTAARALEIGATTNTIRINGLKAGSTFNAASAATTSYMMYANTNGDVLAMPGGAANNVLTWTATGPTWQNASAVSLITANNGAYISAPNNVQFGTNPLIQNTTLPLVGFTLTETSSTAGFSHVIQNTGGGIALEGTSSGTGIYGTSSGAVGNYGIYGSNTSPIQSVGIFGSGNTEGVYGTAPNSIGVLGTSNIGVEGNSATNIGVEGIGVTAVYGIAPGSNGSMGGDFYNSGGGGFYTYAAYLNGATSYGIYSSAEIYSSSTKSTIVEDEKGMTRAMYCDESPEVIFHDYGTSNLNNGRIHIDLDPIYAKNVAINEKHPLRVIITMNDECPNNLYVTNRTATGFDVVEMNHGTSSASFTYEVIANRADKKVKKGEPEKKYSDMRFPNFVVPPPPAKQEMHK